MAKIITAEGMKQQIKHSMKHRCIKPENVLEKLNQPAELKKLLVSAHVQGCPLCKRILMLAIAQGWSTKSPRAISAITEEQPPGRSLFLQNHYQYQTFRIYNISYKLKTFLIPKTTLLSHQKTAFRRNLNIRKLRNWLEIRNLKLEIQFLICWLKSVVLSHLQLRVDLAHGVQYNAYHNQ